MKRTLLFLFCALMGTQVFSETGSSYADYYWYKGNKIYLARGNQEYIIYDNSLLSKSDKEKLTYTESVSYPGYTNLKWGTTKPNAVIKDEEHVLYRTPSYKGDEEGDIFVTHRFYVKLKDKEDLSVLQNMAAQYNAEIEEEDDALPLWYILRCCLPSTYNAMELANIFYESGLFLATEPEMIGGLRHDDDATKWKDIFPTLWGLQRTTCLKNINENEVGTVWGSNSYLMQEIETTTIDGKQYLLFGTNNTYDEYCSLWLREENNKILVYSAAQKKDLVLYDFTLNVGDSLPRLYVDEELSSIVDYFKYEADWEYTKPLFVTEVSTITLLDGKEYKKWTFDNGIEYVEGIGSFGTSYAWNDFYQLIANGPLYSDVFSQHLVCASKNGQLLYKMDEAEMEQLETECLCEIEPKWSETWCDTWNVIREYDGSGSDDVRTHCYQLAQDTVVEGKTYSVLTRYWTADPNSPKEYVGMVRFTDDRKVYANYNGKEYLVYDFSVQAGDTLEVLIGVEDYDHTQTCLVHDVSIDEESNRTVITLYVYDEYSEEFIKDDLFAIKWIEGIGSDNGFYEGIELFSLGIAVPHLLCAYKDGNQVYATNKDFLLKYGCEYNTTTDVEDVTTPTSRFSKMLQDGHLLIHHDGKTYNVMGSSIENK